MATGGNNRGFLAENIPVVGAFQASVVTGTKVEGDKLATEAEHQLQDEKKAATTIQEVLQGFPANVVRAEVIGEPRVKKNTDSAVVLAYDLQVSVYPKEYDSFTSQLIPILEKAATQKGETFAAAEKLGADIHAPWSDYWAYQYARRIFDLDTADKEVKNGMKFSTVMQTWEKNGIRQDWWQSKLDKDSQMAVVVCTKHSGADDKTTWNWYHIPRSDSFRPGVRIEIRFNDKDGQELSRDELLLTQGKIGLTGLHLAERDVSDANGGVIEAMIAPYHIFDDAYYCRTITNL